MSVSPVLWTIGHSNHAFEGFVRLLRHAQIEFLVDVRSFPYSRHAPQFDRDALQSALREQGLGYLFLGEALGGRPSRDDHYDEGGHALYGLMANQPHFVAAVDRLLTGAREHRIAMVCSEGDPHDCHRRLLVGKVLTDRGAELRHILTDGTVVVEKSVELASDERPKLFDEGERGWRSTRSVSHRRRLSASSTG